MFINIASWNVRGIHFWGIKVCNKMNKYIFMYAAFVFFCLLPFRVAAECEGFDRDDRQALIMGVMSGDILSAKKMAVYTANDECSFYDPELAFDFMYAAANAGDPGAQHMIGVYYDIGFGVEKDYSNAYSWFLMAAENGVIGSMVMLANYYNLGIHAEESKDRANYWATRAGISDEFSE
jgi:uncharacterized protein